MRGYSTTMPIFYFNFEKIRYEEEDPTELSVIEFMKFVIDNMQLATECIVICLIYIEILMSTSQIEIRNINWRPLLVTAILLASKFWEDISFWNVDFEDQLDLYPLKAINIMESEFISLCDYNIYVSSLKYNQYKY